MTTIKDFEKEAFDLKEMFRFYMKEIHNSSEEDWYIIASRMESSLKDLIWEVCDEYESDESWDQDPDWDCDNDTGYDPYIGCFSDDC